MAENDQPSRTAQQWEDNPGQDSRPAGAGRSPSVQPPRTPQDWDDAGRSGGPAPHGNATAPMGDPPGSGPGGVAMPDGVEDHNSSGTAMVGSRGAESHNSKY